MPGLRAGKVSTFAVTVEAAVTLYLDQREIARLRDTRTTAQVVPQISIHGQPGLVRVLGARFYALP